MKTIITTIIAVIAFAFTTNLAQAQSKEVAFTQDDRDHMIRTEIKLDERFGSLQKQMDERFAQIDGKFAQVDGKFAQIQKQLDENRADMKSQFITIISGMFILFGFILWDRRTFLKPFQSKVESVEEKLSTEKNKTENLIAALRELAKQDTKVAQVLKQFNLL